MSTDSNVFVRLAACAALASLLAGCAGQRPLQVSLPPAVTPPGGGAQQEPLESFIAKVRHLSSEARPVRPNASTVEGMDRALAAAVAAAATAPTPDTLQRAAAEYRRVGIFDRAHDYLRKALRLAPRDPAISDAMARLWRDSGFPHLALGDAYRAVHYAPRSPVSHNTLGTVFQALGRRGDARARYEQALRLDPSAAYALNNLCYVWILESRADAAVAACRQAIALQPALVAARHNLGLAYAVAGDLVAAHETFQHTGERAQALYNVGIVHLAQRRFRAAVTSFEAAAAARPSLAIAERRAQQARLAARTAGE